MKNPIHTLLLVTALLLGVTACDNPRGPDAGVDGDTGADADRDFISDSDELAVVELDTDLDGTPDYLDLDSDDDGLSDELEAGDVDVMTPPRDADADGVPDFRDTDSDNNGIPDSREGEQDTDADGTPDFADDDDDDDGILDVLELMGRADFPRDIDDDGIPDFRDPDSDSDGILDGHEWGEDTDGDELPDQEDLDSDADGIPDAIEAGDELLATQPIDTDGDNLPDFRDRDSDNDGLPDGSEVAAGTDPLLEDSDNDGVSDLIEVGAMTDPLDPNDNPRINGDFVFVVPFEEPASPSRDTLEFRTNVQFADVYFLFDTTGSMNLEIGAMRDASIEIIDRLTCEDFNMSCGTDGDCEFAVNAVCSAEGRCIENPETSFCIASLWTGVGRYAGLANSYQNLRELQGTPSATQSAIPTSANGGGAAESLFQSVSCVIDPSRCDADSCTATGTGIGCPGYRSDAVRMMIAITDEDNECDTLPSCAPGTATEVGSILQSAQVTFAGINAGTDVQAEEDLRSIAEAANSFASDGSPLVFSGDAAADPEPLIDAVTDAVNEVVRNVPLFVTIDPSDAPGDDGDALQFIERLEVNITRPGCALVDETADVNPRDGHADSFPSVSPGTRVCWDLVVRRNRTVPPGEEPLLFRAELTVTGDGSPVDRREVFFLVPPRIDVVIPD